MPNFRATLYYNRPNEPSYEPRRRVVELEAEDKEDFKKQMDECYRVYVHDDISFGPVSQVKKRKKYVVSRVEE